MGVNHYLCVSGRADYLQYTDRSRSVAVDLSLQGSPLLVDFTQATPRRTSTPEIDGFVVQTYALYFAQTMLLGH
jgi:hypothetical protein